MNKKYLPNALRKLRISALALQDKIFLAYGIVFILMFGVVFGITNFLIGVAFDRRVEAYVEELESEVSNNYTVLVDKMRKEVAEKAKAPALHRAILKGQYGFLADSGYFGETDLDIVEYGTAYGTLLGSTWMEDPRIGTNIMRGSGSGNTGTVLALTRSDKIGDNTKIRLRKVEQNDGIEPRLVVEVTQAGDWGFLTGGRLLSKWLETETAIRSDEHPLFLVQENLTGQRTHATASLTEKMWIPLNNASRYALALREEWARRTAELPQEPERTHDKVAHHKVDLRLADANTERLWTGFQVVLQVGPLGSLFGDPQRVVLVLAYSHQRHLEWQKQLTIIMLLSGAGGLGLVYLISYVMSRRITRPIATLRAGVEEIASGNLDYRVEVPSKSEIGQLAEGFNQMARDLKRSLAERVAAERAATWRDVAQQVAHEVKNPLFPIRLSVENLQQAKASPEIFENIFQECTDTIIEEVDRIGRLIDEFQQFARMPKLKRERVDLNEIVTSVLTLYRGGRTGELPPLPDNVTEQEAEALRRLANPKVDIETVLNPLPKLSLDPAQIAQVLGNLFKNAIEAMPEGGTLQVRTGVRPNGTGDETETVALVVKDTGYGMSPETLEGLFTPYYTTKTDGIGLGMAISQRIVTEHGGEIDVKSDERVGTTVQIEFPHAKQTSNNR